MAAAPRTSTAAHKRALVGIQADLRRLKIIKANQDKIVQQIQQLIARYNKSETLASQVREKVDATVAGVIAKIG
jgi:hypothetical protein